MNSKVKLPWATGSTVDPEWKCKCIGEMAETLNVGYRKAWDKSQLLWMELNCLLKVIQNYE